MKLDNYLSDLLYRYECVIVPNFGAFVTNEISAIIDKESKLMHPPKKELSFNSYLKNNDGLLANHIASVENLSYTEALLRMNTAINSWKKTLEEATLTIDKIGSLHRDTHKNIIFKPNNSENYLTSSFGLSTVQAEPITRTEVIEHPEVTIKKEISPLLRYAASAAIVFTIGGSIGWNLYSKDQYKQQLVLEKAQQDLLDQKIQRATFTIANPLPAISVETIVQEEKDNYFIIAGAYRAYENAEKKISQLQAKGYSDAKIIGENKWGLTQVAYTSFNNGDVAREQLKQIKCSDNKRAWLLIK